MYVCMYACMYVYVCVCVYVCVYGCLLRETMIAEIESNCPACFSSFN